MEPQRDSQSEPKVQEPTSLDWGAGVALETSLVRQMWVQPSQQEELSVHQVLDESSSVRIEYQNYRALVERAIEVFGDELKAALWLSTPSTDLEDKVPLQIAQSVHYAADELRGIFEPVFVRIEHGIYT